MLTRLQQLNPELNIQSVETAEFSKYGRLLTEYDFSELINLMKDFPVPTNTNTYTAEVDETKTMPLYTELSTCLYGEMPIQIGFGGGYNVSLNALEWHNGNEVNVAISDFLVMLASIQDIVDGKIDSAKVKTFYLKKGQAIEMYGTTLHYSPCNVCNDVFRMIVVLPKGTNLPLDSKLEKGNMLTAKNKWLIAHPEASSEVNAGAYVGITGLNLTVKI